MSASRPRYAALALAAALLLAPLPARAAPPGPSDLPASFQILLQRSIFSRDKTRVVSGRTGRTRTIFEDSPAANGPPIFVGAIRADSGESVAILEEPQTGATEVVGVGQTLKQRGVELGTVEQIALETMVLRPPAGAPPRRIDVGQTLTGEERPEPAAAPAPGDAAPGAGGVDASQPAFRGGPVAVDPKVEALKQRRLRELQGGQ
jgi:hypothetical protein